MMRLTPPFCSVRREYGSTQPRNRGCLDGSVVTITPQVHAFSTSRQAEAMGWLLAARSWKPLCREAWRLRISAVGRRREGMGRRWFRRRAIVDTIGKMH
jgi:hypothetical protein